MTSSISWRNSWAVPLRRQWKCILFDTIVSASWTGRRRGNGIGFCLVAAHFHGSKHFISDGEHAPQQVTPLQFFPFRSFQWRISLFNFQISIALPVWRKDQHTIGIYLSWRFWRLHCLPLGYLGCMHSYLTRHFTPVRWLMSRNVFTKATSIKCNSVLFSMKIELES